MAETWDETVVGAVRLLNEQFRGQVDCEPFSTAREGVSIAVLVCGPDGCTEEAARVRLLPSALMTTPSEWLGTTLEVGRTGPAIEVTSDGEAWPYLREVRPYDLSRIILLNILRYCHENALDLVDAWTPNAYADMAVYVFAGTTIPVLPVEEVSNG